MEDDHQDGHRQQHLERPELQDDQLPAQHRHRASTAVHAARPPRQTTHDAARGEPAPRTLDAAVSITAELRSRWPRQGLRRGRSTQERADGQRVRARPQKHVDRLGRRAHDRFAVDVEAGVEHRAHRPPRSRFRAAAPRTRPAPSSGTSCGRHVPSMLMTPRSAAEIRSRHCVGHRHRPVRRARPVRQHAGGASLSSMLGQNG